MLKNINAILPLTTDKVSIVGSNAQSAADPNYFPDRGGINGHIGIGWGSGSTDFPYLVSPLEAFNNRFNGTTKFVSDLSTRHGGVGIVFVYADSGEAYITVDGNAGDRTNWKLWDDGDELILNAIKVFDSVIVAVTSPGPVDMTRWIDKVEAVVFTTFLGQGAL